MNRHRSVEFGARAGDHGRVASSPISDELVTSGRRRAVLAKLPRMYRADGSAIRVLLVDDEVVLTSLVSLALGYEGWVVDMAHDGATALQKYRDERPDVVVLDIM